MNYEKKMEIMSAAVMAELGMDKLNANLQKGIIDGFLRIEQAEAAERQAMDPHCFFPVERIQEGFGFWNSGGFCPGERLGESAVAAGLDGEKLRQVQYENEKNGRHSMAVVYPGCYLALSVANDMYESADTAVYQIVGFSRAADGYQARCVKVLQVNPRFSRLTEEQEKQLDRLIKVSNQIATTPDMYKLRGMV